MSEPRTSTPGEAESEPAKSSDPSSDPNEPPGEASAEAAAPQAERVDEEGLPLDRDATIDDVRLGTGQHGRFAIGCTLAIVLLIVVFWLIRAGVIG